jgi:hypothetical protein
LLRARQLRSADADQNNQNISKHAGILNEDREKS